MTKLAMLLPAFMGLLAVGCATQADIGRFVPIREEAHVEDLELQFHTNLDVTANETEYWFFVPVRGSTQASVERDTASKDAFAVRVFVGTSSNNVQLKPSFSMVNAQAVYDPSAVTYGTEKGYGYCESSVANSAAPILIYPSRKPLLGTCIQLTFPLQKKDVEDAFVLKFDISADSGKTWHTTKVEFQWSQYRQQYN